MSYYLDNALATGWTPQKQYQVKDANGNVIGWDAEQYSYNPNIGDTMQNTRVDPWENVLASPLTYQAGSIPDDVLAEMVQYRSPSFMTFGAGTSGAEYLLPQLKTLAPNASDADIAKAIISGYQNHYDSAGRGYNESSGPSVLNYIGRSLAGDQAFNAYSQTPEAQAFSNGLQATAQKVASSMEAQNNMPWYSDYKDFFKVLGPSLGLGFGFGSGALDFLGGSGASSAAQTGGSLADAAANYGWSDAATAGTSSLFDGYGAGAVGGSAGATGSSATNLFNPVGGSSSATSSPLYQAATSGGTQPMTFLDDLYSTVGGFTPDPNLTSLADIYGGATNQSVANMDWLNQGLSSNPLYSGATSGGGFFDSAGNFLKNNSSSLLKLAMAGGGALLGGIQPSNKPAGQTTVTQEPWKAQQPYLLDAFNKASQAINNPPPLQTQATSQYSKMVGGPTSNPYFGMNNPYLNDAITNAQNDVTRQMQGQFNTANRQSGSFGNSGLQETYARELPKQLGQISTNMRMQDYGLQAQLGENAANRTQTAVTNANTFSNQPLANYSNLVGGNNWGGSVSTPYFTNQGAGLLGGAMAGLGAYKSIFG